MCGGCPPSNPDKSFDKETNLSSYSTVRSNGRPIRIRHYNNIHEGKALAPPKNNERWMKSHFLVWFIEVQVDHFSLQQRTMR